MNSFKERAARARAAYEKAAQPTAYEKAIQNSFPLGAGLRRRGWEKRINACLDKATRLERLRELAEKYEAQVRRWEAPKSPAQIRAEEHRKTLADRMKAARASMQGRQLWEVSAEVYADACGNFAGEGRALRIYEHEQAVKQAIKKGQCTP